MSLQLIQDGNGENTGVFIPYNEWSKLKKQHKELAELEEGGAKEQILTNIKNGLDEVRSFKNGKLKKTSANDFLNGL